MSKINVTLQNPASILVLQAMCSKAGDSDILEVFGIKKGSDVDVKMFVNGVEVDASQTLADAWKRLEGSYEQHLTNKAKELLDMTKFDELRNTIEMAEWQIEQALEKALKEG